MAEVDIGFGEIVKAALRGIPAAVGVGEGFLGNLDTLALCSAENICTEVAVTDRNGPTLPVVVGMRLDKRCTRAEVGVYVVIALGYTV